MLSQDRGVFAGWVSYPYLPSCPSSRVPSPRSLPADSENTAVTLSALLASLNSCCNPWIYMLFSGHLLHDFLRCFPCCRPIAGGSVRRTTVTDKAPTARTTASTSNSWREPCNSRKSSQSIVLDYPCRAGHSITHES